MSDKILFTETETLHTEAADGEIVAEPACGEEELFGKEQGMRILVAWDDADQGDLIQLYLTASNIHEAVIVRDAESLREQMRNNLWDVLLLCLPFPDETAAFGLFQELRRLQPECPVVGACHQQEIIRVPRFLMQGMRTYVIRDAGGDFIFLLQTILQDTVESVRAERERLLTHRLIEEVEAVRKLQSSIIPRRMECPAHYEILGRYEPSQIRVVGGRPVTMAGGDYYDAIMLDEENLIVLVGDASGHGMRACLSIVIMHTLIRTVREQQSLHSHGLEGDPGQTCSYDPARFLASVNRHLCNQAIIQEEQGFITLLYGVLNTRTHEFVWASAGHNPPLLQCLDSGDIQPMGTHEQGGLPLGITPEAEYENYLDFIPAASRLTLYTDGLLEAFVEGSHNGHVEFGMEGVRRSLRNTSQSPLLDALEGLLNDSQSFTNGAGRHDDTSIVLIERRD